MSCHWMSFKHTRQVQDLAPNEFPVWGSEIFQHTCKSPHRHRIWTKWFLFLVWRSSTHLCIKIMNAHMHDAILPVTVWTRGMRYFLNVID